MRSSKSDFLSFLCWALASRMVDRWAASSKGTSPLMALETYVICMQDRDVYYVHDDDDDSFQSLSPRTGLFNVYLHCTCRLGVELIITVQEIEDINYSDCHD